MIVPDPSMEVNLMAYEDHLVVTILDKRIHAEISIN